MWREIPDGVCDLSIELDLLGVLVRVDDFAGLDELGILDRDVIEEVEHLLGALRREGVRKRSNSQQRSECSGYDSENKGSHLEGISGIEKRES